MPTSTNKNQCTSSGEKLIYWEKKNSLLGSMPVQRMEELVLQTTGLPSGSETRGFIEQKSGVRAVESWMKVIGQE